MLPFFAITPTPKQQLFLERQELEVFFGGAAGGGKSVALLMGALQFVDRPGYAALILRKDLPRLFLPGGLIPRSHEWLIGTDAKWNQARRQWRFPVEDGPPATLTFGYLSRPLDKYRYASSEFQYIAFDELTDFSLDDYLFLFSRLRKPRIIDAPLRMRSASNPGGLGHAWVKERFVSQGSGDRRQESGPTRDSTDSCPLTPDSLPPSPSGTFEKHGRLYIPSRIADNPALDQTEYRRSLSHLPPLIRERLMNGDWSVEENGLIRAESFRYYIEKDGQLELLDAAGRCIQEVPDGACFRLITIDPAGTSAERTAEANGRPRSYSVLQVWDRPPRELAKFLLLRHQERKQVGFEGLCRMILESAARWRPDRIGIEAERLGQAVVDLLKNDLPIETVPTQNKDKATRAARLLWKFERGEVFFPRLETTWRPALEAECLAWTGDKRQVTDQIDAAAYAAILTDDGLPHAIRIGPLVMHA